MNLLLNAPVGTREARSCDGISAPGERSKLTTESLERQGAAHLATRTL
jgi:hypothetical protein